MNDLMLSIGDMLNYVVNENKDIVNRTAEYVQAKKAADTLLNKGFATIETLPDGTKQTTIIPYKFIAACSPIGYDALVKLKCRAVRDNMDFTLQDDIIKQAIGLFMVEQKAAIYMLKKEFNMVNYNAKKIINFLIDKGIISDETVQNREHKVLITLDEYNALCGETKTPQSAAPQLHVHETTAQVNSSADSLSLHDDLVKQIIKTFLIKQEVQFDYMMNKFNIGYIKAKKITNFLEKSGVIKQVGASDWALIITTDEYEDIYGEKLN